MFKRVFSLSVLLVVFFVVAGSVSAQQVDNTENELTQSEIDTLLNEVGMTEEEINDLPIDFLRELIAEGAKKNFSQKKNVVLKDPKEKAKKNSMLNFETMRVNGDLNGHMEIYGSAYEVTSDYPGYKKFRLWGRFQWTSVPQQTWTDRFAIGWPQSEGVFFRTFSNGGIQLHTHTYYTGSIRRDYGSQPDRAEPNAGVGINVDLIQGQGSKHLGHIDQYVYVRANTSGDMNVKFEYGHAIAGITPSWTVGTTGLGIATSWHNDTGWVMDTLAW